MVKAQAGGLKPLFDPSSRRCTLGSFRELRSLTFVPLVCLSGDTVLVRVTVQFVFGNH